MQFTFQSEFPISAHEVYSWHLKTSALERLIPPWINASILLPASRLENEAKVVIRLKWGPLSMKWVLVHQNCIADQEFSDVQVKGPFKCYQHRHRFVARDCISSLLVDEITYDFPLPLLAKKIQSEFSRYFSWRHKVLKDDLVAYDRYSRKPLKILLSGASGFIGSKLKVFLQLSGCEVISLVRNKVQCAGDAVFWDPAQGDLKKEEFEGFDAVIHLAGAGIANQRWTKKVKEKLFLSRCRDTWLLSQVLSRLYRPPRTLICASAIGYYGDRKEEELVEESKSGDGFLADLCVKWEKATEAIENRGTRVIHSRFGGVLGAKGGMLRKMIGIYQWGLGGKIGSGRQIVSWIGIDDLLGALYHCLMKEEISGAVNFVAPHSLTQAEFSRLLAEKMGRPAFCHVPRFVLKLALGEMAKELMLSSQKVTPQKLLKTGYAFRYPDLKTALDYVM